jgi:hypothetical protein
VNDWLKLVPISRTMFYAKRNEGLIETVKCGGATLVRTPPKDFVTSLSSQSKAA